MHISLKFRVLASGNLLDNRSVINEWRILQKRIAFLCSFYKPTPVSASTTQDDLLFLISSVLICIRASFCPTAYTHVKW